MADEGTDEQEKFDGLSHPEIMALFSEKLAEIMSDPLLIGLPSEPTLDEVNSQIALEHGRAIVVNVRQQDEINTVLRKYDIILELHTSWKNLETVERRKGMVFKQFSLG